MRNILFPILAVLVSASTAMAMEPKEEAPASGWGFWGVPMFLSKITTAVNMWGSTAAPADLPVAQNTDEPIAAPRSEPSAQKIANEDIVAWCKAQQYWLESFEKGVGEYPSLLAEAVAYVRALLPKPERLEAENVQQAMIVINYFDVVKSSNQANLGENHQAELLSALVESYDFALLSPYCKKFEALQMPLLRDAFSHGRHWRVKNRDYVLVDLRGVQDWCERQMSWLPQDTDTEAHKQRVIEAAEFVKEFIIPSADQISAETLGMIAYIEQFFHKHARCSESLLYGVASRFANNELEPCLSKLRGLREENAEQSQLEKKLRACKFAKMRECQRR